MSLLKTDKPVNDLHSSEARWFAVQTRSKSEKFVKRMLEKKAVTAYLPLQKFIRQYQRTKRVVEKPLINCYVFVHITSDQYLSVLETEHVLGFVKLGRDLIAIPERDLQTIRRITQEAGLEVEVIQGIFETGDQVEIAAGALAGLRGQIIKKEGKRMFQVELASLSMRLLISIDASMLAKHV